ncbi:glycosyltransferase [Amylibacter sp.]|nr:glycosyltransferase [Amylibacter sp.]
MALKTCIVMATYRGAGHVGEQIESLFRQSVLPDSLVVRDDCSDDGTVIELERLKVLSPFPFKILQGDKNIGFKANFSKALKGACADVYFFSDQDDVWFPEKVERHLKLYRSFPQTLAVISNQEIVGPMLERSGRTSLDEIRKIRGDDRAFVHGCCTSFSHQLYTIACAPQEGVGHDDWVHILADACAKRRIIEEPLQLFRRHSQTTTSSTFNNFESPSKTKRTADKDQVAANLRRRATIFQSIAQALEITAELPAEIKKVGVDNSRQNADYAIKRARNLEKGLRGAFLIISEVLFGHQTTRTGLADIYRIVSATLRND